MIDLQLPPEFRPLLTSGLIQDLGATAFASSISQLALENLPVDYVAINLHDSQYRLIERLGELSLAQQEVADTVDRMATFRFDPNNELVQGLRNRRLRLYRNRVQFDQTRQKRYHDLFRERFNLIDRLSLISPWGSHWIVCSFYRTRTSGAFESTEIDPLTVAGEWINSVSRLHLRLRITDALCSGESEKVMPALGLAFEELSARELQVAAHLVCGHSNQQIALLIEVGQETVRTFRRRLRQKSGCRDGGELIKECLNRLQAG